MPPYPVARTYFGALAAIIAVIIAALGLLSIAPATPTIMFICVLLLGLACLA